LAESPSSGRRTARLVGLIAVAALAAVAAVGLLVNIFERKTEARTHFIAWSS
jgi:hypothetical protein